MCNVLYLSTSSDLDLSTVSKGLFRPERLEERGTNVQLAFKNRWFIACKYGGCSCHFRHLNMIPDQEPWFGPPEDWCPEDEEDIESTAAVYDLIANLVRSGHGVDLVDFWDGEEDKVPIQLEVSVSTLPREHFKFFEGYRFVFIP